MAEMLGSALVQETVSRGVSFVLGKREEKASQGHLAERLEMAISQLEFALERAQQLRIRDLSLISQRNMIKRAYVEAMELLGRHKQQNAVPPGQELQVAQGVKRKRWLFFWAKDVPITSSFAGLTTDVVRRFEMYADYARKFVRGVVESGCSLHHYDSCYPIVRRLLEGKSLWYHLKQGNLARKLHIWPTYSDERGVEAVLLYCYKDSTMAEKYFTLMLSLRLSESTDIVGLVIKVLQLLKAAFKHPVECAMAELTLVPNLQLQDMAHLSATDLVWQQFVRTQFSRPDPACCGGRRHGICAKDNVSSGLADIFPEQVISWDFEFNCVPALESSTRSSFDEVGRGCNPPMEVSIEFRPHSQSIIYILNKLEYLLDLSEGGSVKVPYNYAVQRIGHDVGKCIHDVSIQEVVETVKSNAISCFSRQPELRDYRMDWSSEHGSAWFFVKNASVETTAGVPRTRKRYNTRSSKNKGASSRR